jgi:hypothetical protein
LTLEPHVLSFKLTGKIYDEQTRYYLAGNSSKDKTNPTHKRTQACNIPTYTQCLKASAAVASPRALPAGAAPADLTREVHQEAVLPPRVGAVPAALEDLRK